MLQALLDGTGQTDPRRSPAESREVSRWRNVRLWIDARIGPSISLARNRWRRYERLNRRQARHSQPSSIGRGSRAMDGIAKLDVSLICKTSCVAAIARRHDAVEEIDPGGHGVQDILRPADAHQVARPVGGQKVGRDRQGLPDFSRGPRRR